MALLLNELKKEHSVIVNMLNKITELGIGSKDRQDILFSAKTGLLAHVKKEDANLYPALKKAAEKDESLRMMLDMFANDMNTISMAAFGFFDKYSQGNSGLELDFAVDLGRLLGLLELRIRKEENILYPEYEKIKV
ncbi:MAG: hemerythrin domain-containing protein [Nitrospirae bacterium]|nr:hemerythrin domain-containing protein [Nitrospirota bacterium]